MTHPDGPARPARPTTGKVTATVTARGPRRALAAGCCVLFAALWPSNLDAQCAAVQPLALSGDIGFRMETIRNEDFAEGRSTSPDDHRYRWRGRARLAGTYCADSPWSAGLRLTTGSPSYPSSAWTSFSDNLTRDDVALDRFYVRWTPNSSFRARFGADGNPIPHPLEIVWDGDVQLSGLAQIWSPGRLRIVATQSMLREARDTRRVGGAFLTTFGGRIETTRVRAGVFAYNYSDADAVATAIRSQTLSRDYATNRLLPSDSSRFFSGFNLLGANVDFQAGRLRVLAEAAVNSSARADASLGPAYASRENLAFGAEGRIGGNAGRWDWGLRAGYVHIEADATLAAFNSDDLQQTNVRTVTLRADATMPGGGQLIWDTYIQRKLDLALPSPGGLTHAQNATKLRSRLSIALSF